MTFVFQKKGQELHMDQENLRAVSCVILSILIVTNSSVPRDFVQKSISHNSIAFIDIFRHFFAEIKLKGKEIL